MAWAATGAQSFSRDYIYDELNRLKAMASTGASCTALEWTYDIWANRTNQNLGPGGAACGTHHPTINTKNQIADTGYVYDAAGNMTAEPGKTYQYDAEGRLKSLNSGCPSTLCYTYDANGRRVRKIASGVTTEYIYHQSGIVVAEKVGSSWTVGYVYLSGGLIAQYKNGTTYFVHKDHLGSARLLTKPDQSFDPADIYDYLPFGEALGSAGTTTSHRFTGHERDTETNLDYFGARYYGSLSGRFVTPDPLMASGVVRNPQTWNRYSYVLNNPVRLVDPDGLDSDCPVDAGCEVTVNVNVIYDKNANNGKGLTDEQKKKLVEEFLADAKKKYGDASVGFEVTFTEGTLDASSGKLTGTVDGAINVFASDQQFAGKDELSGMLGDKHVTLLNVTSDDAGLLTHGFSHHILGHGTPSAFARTLTTILSLPLGGPLLGMDKQVYNLFADIEISAALSNTTQGAKIENAAMGLPNPLTGAAKRFAASLSQSSLKPKD